MKLALAKHSLKKINILPSAGQEIKNLTQLKTSHLIFVVVIVVVVIFNHLTVKCHFVTKKGITPKICRLCVCHNK